MLRRSMRVRITGTFALLLAVVLAAACAALLGYVRRSSELAARRTLRTTILRVAADLGDAAPDRLSEVQEDEAAIRAEGVALVVLDEQNHPLWSTRGSVPALKGSSGEWITAVRHAGSLTILAGMRRKPMQEQLARHALLLGILAAITLAAATTGAWIVVGRTLRPIHELAGQAAEASVHSLNVSLEAPSADAEVVELVQTLNDLIARIAQAARARGRFYAAASHELRTPLQALSGHLALALTRPRSADEYRKALTEADLQARRLIALVQDLLLLHQLDAPAAPQLPAEEIDLEALALEELRRLEARFQSRNLRANLSLAASRVTAYPGHLQILLRNLLENAAKYATAGTEVQIEGIRKDGELHLRIFNECQPLGDELLATLFEPFARLHARGTSDPEEGSGLGLAICHAIAQANGWILTAKSAPNGFEITVVFPWQRRGKQSR